MDGPGKALLRHSCPAVVASQLALHEEQRESDLVLTKDVCVSQPTEQFLVYLVGRSELQLVMEAIY